MTGPQVLTANGWVEGFSEGAIQKFFGVPYASPPTGELRWKSPAPKKPWQGVRQAKKFGPRCPQTVGVCFQTREEKESEDCLYLNIWARKDAAQGPVMVWIHGGGFLGGSGSENAYDGTQLASKGATVVTFNYRLGAFGYAAHPSIGANFGLQDQIVALRWVRHNISLFGGDPGNVTVFGESAGAVSIRCLLASPPAYGLFSRAILQSGSFEAGINKAQRTYDDAQKVTEHLFEELGASDVDTLRQVSADEVKAASHKLCGAPPPSGQVHTPRNLQWFPVIDGEIITDSGYDGWPENVPVIMGCTRDEARYFLLPTGSYPPPIFETMTNILCGPVANDVIDALSTSETTEYDRLERVFTASIFTEPCLASLRDFVKNGRKVFAYHFGKVSPGAAKHGQRAEHTGEIPYVFGNLHIRGEEYCDETDAKVSEMMQDAWLSFAKTGERGSMWSEFDTKSMLTMWFGDEPRIEPFPVSNVVSVIAQERRRITEG